MRHAALLPALLLLPLLSGCGSSPAGTNPNPPGTIPAKSLPATALNGLWQIAADTSHPSAITSFTGALQTSGDKVTGTLHALTAPAASCVDPFTDLAAAGQIDASGALTLTLPIAGGVATLTATIPANPATRASGTWQILGGSCAMASTPIHLQHLSTSADSSIPSL